MVTMLSQLKNEIIPIMIVAALLAAALRYWLALLSMPDDLSVLMTAIVAWYFGSRSGAAVATRALNGSSNSTGSNPGGGI